MLGPDRRTRVLDPISLALRYNMFIRARPYTTVEGKKCHSFSLLQSKRVDGTPRHFTLLNLNSGFSIPKEDRGELTQCVVSQLKGQDFLCHKEGDDDFQKALDLIVKQLQDKRLRCLCEAAGFPQQDPHQ